MLLVEIKDFNALIDNKPFFDQRSKNKEKTYEKLLQFQKTVILQQKIYYIICIIKNIINIV